LRDLHINAGTNEARLAKLKRQQQSQQDATKDQGDNDSKSYDTSTEASFEKGCNDIDEVQIKLHAKKEAEQVCARFRNRIQALLVSYHNCKQQTEVLRQNLSEAVELVVPLKEHVLRIDNEKAALEYKLAKKSKRLILSEQNSGALNSKNPQDRSVHSAQQSLSNLLQKDEEIIDLKIEIDQLREELKRTDSDLVNIEGVQETFNDMPTPTKHNISARKNRRKTLTSQPGNEEEATQSRMFESHISRLQLEIKNRTSTEKTLKSMLQNASLRITALNLQVEEFLHQKLQAEKEMNDQKLNIANLEDALTKKSLRSSVSIKESNDQVFEYKELLKEMTARNDKLVIDVDSLKIELKINSKEKKKLKKSLEEAVVMLNSLRSHVETAEKERKKLKKQLRSLLLKKQEEGMNSSSILEPNPTSFHEPDPDEMANRSTILQLRSVVVEMEHQIRTLEERIQELENCNTQQRQLSLNIEDGHHNHENNTNNNHSSQLPERHEELAELRGVYNSTKQKLDEITEINREMLMDLQQTEEQASETWQELVSTKLNLESVREEMENALSMACTVIRKLDMVGFAFDEGDYDSSTLEESIKLTDCMNRINRRLESLLDYIGETREN
jgi:chromosome segregation ATPase